MIFRLPAGNPDIVYVEGLERKKRDAVLRCLSCLRELPIRMAKIKSGYPGYTGLPGYI
jgi:hypothetical protein